MSLRRVKNLEVASIVVLPWLHEVGHLLGALFFGVPVNSVFLVPQQIGSRFGIGVNLEWLDVSPVARVMVLLGGFLFTSVVALGLMQRTVTEGIGLVWLLGAPMICGYDFGDVAGILGFPVWGEYLSGSSPSPPTLIGD